MRTSPAEENPAASGFAPGSGSAAKPSYSPLDLFLKDGDGSLARLFQQLTTGRAISEVVRLLSSHTDRGFAYRVDLRLRPEGNRGPLARSLASTLSYYDTMGRTWNRTVAGQPRVRVNAVGFFFDSVEVGAFLWALARDNDGSFVGMSKP